MTMKYLKGLAITLLAFLMLYLAGPRPAKPAYSTVLPEVPSEALALEQYIRDQEAQHAIKPNNVLYGLTTVCALPPNMHWSTCMDFQPHKWRVIPYTVIWPRILE